MWMYFSDEIMQFIFKNKLGSTVLPFTPQLL